MTDDPFERELRGFLDGRAPAAAGPALRARLLTVTATPPARTLGWRGWLGGPARVGLGVGGTAIVVVALLAAMAGSGQLTTRDPGRVGASPVPGIPAVPFVIAPAGLFTESAELDARRRLDAVYAATGVEATLIVQVADSTARISAPDGWPERFDRDGDRDRDITAVFGIAPDGTVLCCMTLLGDLIVEAQTAGYWRPLDMPGALDGDLAAATPEFRDVALDRFVRGIEDLAPNLATLRAGGMSTDDLRGAIGIAMVLGPVLLLAAVGLRRRRIASASASWTVDMELVELPQRGFEDPTPTVAQRGADRDPLVAWRPPAAVPASRRWPDRRLVGVIVAVVVGFAILSVADLLLPPATSVRLDPSLERSGMAGAGPNIVPLVLLAVGLGALAAYARQGGWRRRIGVVAMALSVGWPLSTVWTDARPILPDRDRGWVTTGSAVTWRDGMGVTEQLTYALAPGEMFTLATTIRNPGVVPVTVLGLDGVRTTAPNPYVASVVGLGWVVQAMDDGTITTLSARPEDAAASWPVTIRPGGSLAIVIVGRAGPCADPNGTASGLPLTHVGVVYRVLGFERSTEVGLPAVLSFPSRSPCTVDVPGGTVTFSAP